MVRLPRPSINRASQRQLRIRNADVSMTQQDTVLVCLLAYADLRPGEALALVRGDITARHIRASSARSRSEIREDDDVKRHDRSVRLLQPLVEDLRAWEDARGAIPLPTSSCSLAATAASGRTTTGATGASASSSPPQRRLV
jgi:hypothetical protein